MTIKREINHIVVHCSASPQGRGDDASDIHRWHIERGFTMIGYHHVLLENGLLQYGRPEYMIGAHAKGVNATSIGICLIGEGGDATDKQLDSLETLITTLLMEYPDAELVGHCDIDPINKPNCPGFGVKDWYNIILEQEDDLS